jgi:3-hydroxyisobutyrate dehydrogenase-like beta-hydroxyacid dehydrogenase
MRVGFIGLGIMGSRMAANLQRGGHELAVFNRTRSKAEPLLAAGATWADTPALLAEQVDVLFTMLAHPEAVAAVALGEEGFLERLRPGTIWADCSTVNPSFSRQMADQAAQRQVRFLDAPVAGTKGPAGEGALLFLVGGEAADVDACRPFFELMGRRTIHVGGHGMGTSLKMVFNLLLAEAMLSFAESMILGQALGISRDALFEALLGGPMVAPFVTAKRAKIEGGTYEADFPLQWMRKDLHLASITAYEQDVALPAGNVAKEIYALAEQYGLGEKDFSAIYQFLEAEA